MADKVAPVKVLQGDVPAYTREEIRAFVLELLRSDPEVRALLGAPAPAGPTEPSAEAGRWVVALIEEKLRQHINPHALRRPLT